jgi:tripartite-type tricarboxylate transporter receptor subunit TctC
MNKTGLLLAASFVATAAALPVSAQDYPTRPVRIVIPLAPGGGMDFITRATAQRLTDSLGQTFVVDNRPGAGSQLAMGIVGSSAPDGYTLLMVSATTTIHPLLYQAKYDVARDFAPVTQATAQGYNLVVHPSVPAKDVPGLIKFLHANPGVHNFASSGIGSPLHMTGELFKIATGVKMTHVPYKGMGAAYADIVAGSVKVSFAAINSSQPHVKAGRLRVLAVTTPERVPALPDIPTMIESGVKEVVVVNWYGLVAPLKTPKALVDRISHEFSKVLRSQEMQKQLLSDGSSGVGSTPEEFAAHMKAERAMWAKVVKQAGIKVN